MANAPKRQRVWPLLDLPGACVNPVRAAQLGFWRVEEAAAFTMGFDRRFLNRSTVASAYQNTPEATEFSWRVELLERQIELGDLEERPRPQAVLNWAKTRAVEVPAELEAAVLRVSTAEASNSPTRIVAPALPVQAGGHPPPDSVAANVLQQSRLGGLTQRLNSAQRIICGLLSCRYGLVPGRATEKDMAAPVADLRSTGFPIDPKTLLRHFVEGSGQAAKKKND